MKLLKCLTDNKKSAGFTLIELLLGLGILILIFAIGAPVSLTFYLDYQLNSEHELLKSVLRQAENFSLVNRNLSAHGVYLDTDNLISFEGPNFSSRILSEDRVFPRTKSISVSGPTEIVFESLSGRTASSTYTFSNGRKNAYIYVNSEGTISD